MTKLQFKERQVTAKRRGGRIVIAALRDRLAAALAMALYAAANKLNRDQNLGPIWRPGQK